MKIADSLGIAQILPLDADRSALRRAIADTMNVKDVAPTPARRTERPATQDAESLEGLISRVLLDLTRQFRVPLAAAYLRIRDERRFAAYGSVPETSPSLDWSNVLELLPHAAGGEDPLLVPDLEHHPLFGHGAALSAIRGFAGVPLARPGGGHWGSLGVFDAKPLALASDDIDALAAFARDVAVEIDQLIGPPVETTPPDHDERFEALEQLAATAPLTGLGNRPGC